MKDINVILALGMTAALAAVAFMTVVLFQRGETKVLPKLTTKSSGVSVINTFNSRLKTNKASETIIWLARGETIYEEILTTGMTKKQKAVFVKEMYRQGNTRYRQICYNIYGKDNMWSAGYCYNTEIIRGGKA